MSRTWTFDERLDALQAQGMISPPFTPDERALARRCAEAQYFSWWLTELPGRCPDQGPAILVMHHGICIVGGKWGRSRTGSNGSDLRGGARRPSMGTGINQEEPSHLYRVTTHEELFTLQEISSRLNVPYRQLWWHIYYGKLRAIYLGGRRLRVTARQLEAYLKARDELLYTVPEVAERLQRSDQEVRALITTGALGVICIGGNRWRVRQSHVEAYLQERKEGSHEARHREA
jgi:excisionase family DNA binding protein